jgi:hypothetical protein
MRVEDARLRARLARPLLIAVLVAAVLVLPTWLWITRGRKLPLTVVLDPPTFVARAGATVPLRPRVAPADEELTIAWSGPGIAKRDRERLEAVWRAPGEAGIYTVTIQVRRSGTVAEDSVSFQVVEASPGRYPVVRPPASRSRPEGLPSCPPAGRRPRVKILGRPCRGASLVAVVEPDGAKEAWHWWAPHPEEAAEGSKADLLLTDPEQEQELISLVVLGQPPCAWSLRTRVRLAGCEAGPRIAGERAFAAFSWQMLGPGYFRLAAKPQRNPGVKTVTYNWTFEDGTSRRTGKPQISHRFGGKPQRYRVVELEVRSDTGQARTARVLVDRSVPR